MARARSAGHPVSDLANSASAQRTLPSRVCTATEPDCPTRIAFTLGQQVWRRPPTDAEIERLLSVHAAAVDGLLDTLAGAGVTTVGTVTTGGEDYAEVGIDGRIAILVGGEGAGLPADVVARLDRQIHIPMREGVDSLSVGAAAAVVLFDVARRRRG